MSYTIEELMQEMEKQGAEVLTIGFGVLDVSLMIVDGYHQFHDRMEKEALAKLICGILAEVSSRESTKQ